MKNNSFNKAIDKYLKEFLSTPSDDLEYLEKFYTTPQIDMTNYHEWSIFGTLNFKIHYYSFWYNPNNNDFEKIIDSFAMSFIAQIMYCMITNKDLYKCYLMLSLYSLLFLLLLIEKK